MVEPAEYAEARKTWPNECCKCGMRFFSCHARDAMWLGDDMDVDYLEELTIFLEKYLADEYRKCKSIKSGDCSTS